MFTKLLRQTAHFMEDEEQVPENVAGRDIYKIFSISQSSVMVSLLINNKQLKMEVDTGAAVSMMKQNKFNQLWSADDRPTLKQTNIRIHIYKVGDIEPCGEGLIEDGHNYNVKYLPIIVLNGNGNGNGHTLELVQVHLLRVCLL